MPEQQPSGSQQGASGGDDDLRAQLAAIQAQNAQLEKNYGELRRTFDQRNQEYASVTRALQQAAGQQAPAEPQVPDGQAYGGFDPYAGEVDPRQLAEQLRKEYRLEIGNLRNEMTAQREIDAALETVMAQFPQYQGDGTFARYLAALAYTGEQPDRPMAERLADASKEVDAWVNQVAQARMATQNQPEPGAFAGPAPMGPSAPVGPMPEKSDLSGLKDPMGARAAEFYQALDAARGGS